LWLQHPKQANVDKLVNVLHEASKYFRKKKEYMNKIDKLETNTKIKKILGNCIGSSMILKKVTGTFLYIIKGEKGDLFTDSHNTMLVRRWKYFSQLLNDVVLKK
jgi:hypothetical protein